MLCKPLACAGHIPRVCEWHRYHVGILSLVICVLTGQSHHVRNVPSFALPTRAVFIVKPTIPRVVKIAGHTVMDIVAVQQTSRVVRHGDMLIVLHVQVVEVPTDRSRQQVK